MIFQLIGIQLIQLLVALLITVKVQDLLKKKMEILEEQVLIVLKWLLQMLK